MTLEDQVCSLELAKKLKELGVNQKSYFAHDISRGTITTSSYAERHPTLKCVAAFTVAELGEMLPLVQNFSPVVSKVGPGNWLCWYLDNEITESPWQFVMFGDAFHAPTEAEARAKMLIYLLENKLINLN